MKRFESLTRQIFRYYPPLCAGVMLHHVLALIVGYNICIHEFIVDGCLIAMIMQMLLSYYFKFCIWHRACIIYNHIVSFCVDYERSVGFGELRDSLRWIVMGIGILILAMFLAKCIRNNDIQDNDID